MLLTVVVWLAFMWAPAEAQSPAAPPWPGLWGPARNAMAPPGTPEQPRSLKELWRRKSAGGYSEVIVGADLVFTMEKAATSDFVVALDPATGRERWRTLVGPTYAGHDGSHDGPIATPALDGRQLFAMGPHGVLLALDAESGREQWRRDLVSEYQAPPPVYGFAVSPLLVGNLVVTQIGGEQGGLLAFNKSDGRLVWRAGHSRSRGYASPVLATIAGVRQIVASAGDHAFGASAEDGRLLWSVSGPGAGAEVGNQPLVFPDDRVLLTYWEQVVMLKISSSGGLMAATELWRSPRLRNTYSPVIYRDGNLYGFAGAFLVCADAATGEVRWRERFYEGSLVGLGPHLLALSQSSGDLHVVRASPDKYAEVTRLTVFTPGATSVTGPSVSGRRIFLRNVEEIVAVIIEG